jgi:MoaA/NifB/PqqE/SkfB family radical SAM enzyme
MNIRKVLTQKHLNAALSTSLSNNSIRRLLFKCIASHLHHESMTDRPEQCPTQAKLDRMDAIIGLLSGLDRIIDRGIVSKQILLRILDSFLGNVILNEDAKRAERKLNAAVPSFVVVSPTGKCNLRCSSCYASDAALKGNELSMAVFDRILREKRELWGSHWTVISGGEPFLWYDNDWNLIRLAKRHPHDIFMVYTNGTLIDDQLAEYIAEAGNITPAISVEGFQAQTDSRRGEGAYQSILRAFAALRGNGVPFGVSATATRDNWEIITSNEFADFYFVEQGALYGWIFQYMPMGRGQNLDLIVPPDLRVEMSSRMWKLVRERKIFLIDFWNSATVSQGCIAAARHGGYFHINWDGDIMPCVFTPYAAGNINDIYAQGGNLNTAVGLPFFKKIRHWQKDYGFQKPAVETGNWLCPCAIRDHFDTFAQAVNLCDARPINAEALYAIENPDYHDGMVKYGERMADLTQNIWSSDYLKSQVSRKK